MSEIIENLETEVARAEAAQGAGKKRRSGAGGGRRDDRREPRVERKEESQFVEKLISVRRVTKVVKGGKNMRFSALVVIVDG